MFDVPKMTRSTLLRNVANTNVISRTSPPVCNVRCHPQVFTAQRTTAGFHHHTFAPAATIAGSRSIASTWPESFSNAMWQICTSETFTLVQFGRTLRTEAKSQPAAEATPRSPRMTQSHATNDLAALPSRLALSFPHLLQLQV
jgi:hypothetical protein